MREAIRQLLDALSRGRDVAYCRLVETRGSTPQKAGAVLLVFPDGSQWGTLGGGCVEAETKRRALAALAAGQAEISRFELDHDYGWDDGLICGGRMRVLIEPLPGGTIPDYFRQLSQVLEAGSAATEAIVFDGPASGAVETAAFLFDEQGRLLVARPSSAAHASAARVQEHLQPLAARPRPYAAQGIGYLPTLLRCRLLIVGGGHVGKAVADLAADLDFDVWVLDDRAEYVSPERFPRAQRRIAGPVAQVLPGLEITPETYCLIVTRGHAHDQEALYHLAQRGARYVGMIGSRRKIKLIFENLLGEGVPADSLAAVYAPLGIEIGSQSVPEIAISICAELVAHRNCGGVVPGRPAAVLEPGNHHQTEFGR